MNAKTKKNFPDIINKSDLDLKSQITDQN